MLKPIQKTTQLLLAAPVLLLAAVFATPVQAAIDQ